MSPPWSGGLYDGDLYRHDRGQATVFLPVEGAPRAIGRVVAFVVPAAELAVICHRGSLHDTDLTYGAPLGPDKACGVPRTRSRHATCTYSWMRPPSRSR